MYFILAMNNMDAPITNSAQDKTKHGKPKSLITYKSCRKIRRREVTYKEKA
jgi:hypothetical protein